MQCAAGTTLAVEKAARGISTEYEGFLMRSRRLVLQGALLASALALSSTLAHADPLKVGILIPGSKSDKGWMESSYDGLMAAEKKYGDKIQVQMIENINYADMDQALTNLASKNELVIGVGGQTQASVYKIAKRFPKIHFSIVGGNEGESAPNVAGYDVKQAEIAYVAGAAAAMLSKTGAISYVGDFGDHGEYRLTSHSGDIEAVVPDNTSADVNARTVRGEVHDDIPLQPKQHTSYVLQKGSAFWGTMGRAAVSSTVVLRSFSGKIHLRKRSEK